MVGQADEGGQIQLLGAQAAVDPCRFDGIGGQQLLERVAQGLAALVEGLTHNAFEQAMVFGGVRQGFMRHQTDDGRVDLGWWVEGPGADVEQVFHAAVVLHHDRQPPPIAAARAGGHALDHFFLQHEVHVANQRCVVQQVENQRRGDVVGQVADNAQAAWWRVEAGEVEFQCVALIQAKARIVAELVLQDGDQVEVEFDHVELCAAAEQTLGNGALAWADLQQAFIFLGANGAQDTVDHPGIMQEVLAEALARAVLVFGHVRLRATPRVVLLEAGCKKESRTVYQRMVPRARAAVSVVHSWRLAAIW